MGYVRTGSVPSIAAGLTVGALVSLCAFHAPTSNADSRVVRSRWLQNPKETAIRHRACPNCFDYTRGKQHSSCDQDRKAASCWPQCAGRKWTVCVWKSVYGQSLRETAAESKEMDCETV